MLASWQKLSQVRIRSACPRPSINSHQDYYSFSFNKYKTPKNFFFSRFFIVGEKTRFQRTPLMTSVCLLVF